MNQRRTRPSGPGPLIVLAIVALVPALALWATWRWADAAAAGNPDGVPVGSVAPPPGPEAPALNTGLLSLRRTAPALSRQLNVGAFEQALQPLLDMVGAGSCAAVSIDGELVGERNQATITVPASTLKIVVAAVAVDVLGADFTYTTRLVGPAPSGGV